MQLLKVTCLFMLSGKTHYQQRIFSSTASPRILPCSINHTVLYTLQYNPFRPPFQLCESCDSFQHRKANLNLRCYPYQALQGMWGQGATCCFITSHERIQLPQYILIKQLLFTVYINLFTDVLSVHAVTLRLLHSISTGKQ